MIQTTQTDSLTLTTEKLDHRDQTQDLSKQNLSKPDFAMIELIFFGYRDFIGEPDRILDRYRFGRAHHRVLHFVHRHPGLTIAALLDILAITKQSLARVLKDLVNHGYVEQRLGSQDRRQRLLFLTSKGAALAAELLEGQNRRISAALAEADLAHTGLAKTGGPSGLGARQVIERFLMTLVEPSSRQQVRQLLSRGRE